jgi:hypothetical protein
MSSEPKPEQEKPARSKRGARVGSCRRHQALIAPMSVAIADAVCGKRSVLSFGEA